jgi:hypothetical protein
MSRHSLCAGVAVGLALAARAIAGPADEAALLDILRRVGTRVEEYFARAQSLVCVEAVHVQPLGIGLTAEGVGRTVQSELQMSWEAPRAADASPEARMLRQVLKVNGHPPRPDDRNNCTVPEQLQTETPALAMLLPDQQPKYAFSLNGPGRLGRRSAILIDYRETARPSVVVQTVANNDDCLSFQMKGGLRGRIWIDAETFDVLRLDQSLIGLVDIPLPESLANRNDGVSSWTMERWDTTIRFQPVAFEHPAETLTLPVSVLSLRIARGSASPRVRTRTEYSQYKRFLTGGRVVKE